MQIELKVPQFREGMVFMVNNVDVVEPFKRSLLLYQKLDWQALLSTCSQNLQHGASFLFVFPAYFIIHKGVADSIRDQKC